MSGDQALHITLTYVTGGYGGSTITRTYAISEGLLNEAQLWQASHCDEISHYCKATSKDLKEWLESKGCQLDSPDGPALIRRTNNGGVLEKHYYRNGKLHREDGPAIVRDQGDSKTEDEYYRDGVRTNPPLSAMPGVTVQRPLPPKALEKPPAPGPA